MEQEIIYVGKPCMLQNHSLTNDTEQQAVPFVKSHISDAYAQH